MPDYRICEFKCCSISGQPNFGMTNYHIRLHRITSDQIWLNKRRLHQPRTACIPVVNHTLAPYTGSWKCLTYTMLEQNPFRLSKVLKESQWTTEPRLLAAILLYRLLERLPVNSSHGQLVTTQNRMTSWPAAETPCCDELTARCCRRRLKDYMSRHSYGARFSINLRKIQRLA